MITIVVTRSSSCGRPPSSIRITAKTIEASPRGPNQPRKPTVGRRAPVPSIATATGQHAGDRQAEDGVERDRPGHGAERRAEHDGSEDDERDRAEDAAELLDQVADLAAVPPPEAAEDHAADERGDEARATHPIGEAVREHGGREGHDLEPRALDEASSARKHDDDGGQRARDDPAEDAVADLLGHEAERRNVAHVAGLRLCDRENDEEQRARRSRRSGRSRRSAPGGRARAGGAA